MNKAELRMYFEPAAQGMCVNCQGVTSSLFMYLERVVVVEHEENTTLFAYSFFKSLKLIFSAHFTFFKLLLLFTQTFMEK